LSSRSGSASPRPQRAAAVPAHHDHVGTDRVDETEQAEDRNAALEVNGHHHAVRLGFVAQALQSHPGLVELQPRAPRLRVGERRLRMDVDEVDARVLATRPPEGLSQRAIGALTEIGGDEDAHGPGGCIRSADARDDVVDCPHRLKRDLT
jgi:hypothetical protein